MVLSYDEILWEETYSFGVIPDLYNSHQSDYEKFIYNNQTQAAENAQKYMDLQTHYSHFLIIACVLLPYILLLLALIPANFLLKTGGLVDRTEQANTEQANIEMESSSNKLEN